MPLLRICCDEHTVRPSVTPVVRSFRWFQSTKCFIHLLLIDSILLKTKIICLTSSRRLMVFRVVPLCCDVERLIRRSTWSLPEPAQVMFRQCSRTYAGTFPERRSRNFPGRANDVKDVKARFCPFDALFCCFSSLLRPPLLLFYCKIAREWAVSSFYHEKVAYSRGICCKNHIFVILSPKKEVWWAKNSANRTVGGS